MKLADRSRTFCVLPWLHLATMPNGTVSPCCESNHFRAENLSRDFSEAKVYNLNRDSIAETMNSEYFRQVRREMLNGQEPAACRDCYRKEHLGVESKRTSENRLYSFNEKHARALTSGEGRLDLDLQFIELRLGNTCNLKCRTCNPYSSSKWAKDHVALRAELPFVAAYEGPQTFPWPDNQPFWDELFERSRSLKRIYINGGEPMLIKKHWLFLERLVESGRAAQVHLLYSTNMTEIPDMAFPIWKAFRKVQVNASIDDLDRRNRYIRFPSDWENVLHCLEKLHDHGIETLLLQTVSAMNFYYIDALTAWAHERGLHVAHNFVKDPAFMDPIILPLSLRREVIEKHTGALPSLKRKDLERLFAQQEVDTLRWNEFVQYTRALDRLRGESFQQVFPELCEALSKAGVEAP